MKKKKAKDLHQLSFKESSQKESHDTSTYIQLAITVTWPDPAARRGWEMQLPF